MIVMGLVFVLQCMQSKNYFDENISLIGTGKHELFANLHEFLESFKFDVKRRGKIRIEVQNLHQEEERLDDDHVLAHGTVDFVGLFKDGSICFKMETRFTIIYKWTNGKWLVQHLHQSTPDLEQMDGEEFPLTLGKQVKKTRQALHALGTVVQDYRRYFLQELRTISLTEQIMYPYVYMDAPHLSEVCLNIISNAIKYTNTGGWISCNVVQKSCEKEDWCNMIISITDNGIGYKKPPV